MGNLKSTGNYIYDKQVLAEYYETKFGIYNHLDKPDPLALVSHHKGESYRVNSLYDNYLRTFIYKDIGKKLGISFDEYLNRPRSEIEAINRVVEEIDNQKNRAQQDALRNVNKGKKKSKLEEGIPDLDLENM